MGTLNASLNMAIDAMTADQTALSVTTNNIANANTPGYSRETVSLAEAPAVEYGGFLIGNGVQIGQITSQRSSLLQAQFDQQTQQQGKYNSYLSTMNQVQSLFNETSGSGLQTPITAFFDSLQQLSTDPTNMSLRQGVLSAAQNLAQAFNNTSSSLTSLQQGANATVTQSVAQINSLTTQIATLNGQVSAAMSTGQNAGTLQDERDQLVNQLSGLVDVSEIDAGNGNLTLTTTNGTALVAGSQSYTLSTQADSGTGFQDVYSQGSNITTSITAGTLGGAIQARDTTIPSILNSLDQLASDMSSSINSVNQAGTDLNGAQGGNIFSAPPAGVTGSAGSMTVTMTDPSKIAASLDGSTGDNSNLTAMLALQNQTNVKGQTPLSAYSSLIYQIGNDVSSAQSELSGSQALSSQLQNQIGSISGVSTNEEAANLIQFQQAYEAAAQVASIIDKLTATAIDIGQTVTAT